MSTVVETKILLKNKRNLPYSFPSGIYVEGKKLRVNEDGSVTTEGDDVNRGREVLTQSSSGTITPASLISKNSENRLKEGQDGKLYVQDNFDPDILAYYILAKN